MGGGLPPSWVPTSSVPSHADIAIGYNRVQVEPSPVFLGRAPTPPARFRA